MIHKRILIVATYPAAQPRDGGQKRVAAIVKEYEKVFDEVRFIAVFKGRYPKYNASDIYVTTNGGVDGYLVPFVGDVIAGEAINNDPTVRRKLTKLLLDYNPEIIQIEQTFPYLGLKPLLQSLGLSPQIVLSSHNVEYAMKQEILAGVGVPQEVYAPIVKKIKVAEETLSRDAELVIAVSEEDAKAHQAMGAKYTVVAPNGIEKVIPSQRAKDYWRTMMRRMSIAHIATFVGSAHPPNWIGFLKMVSDRVGFIPPDSKLFLAGGVADYLEQNINTSTPGGVTFWQRVYAAGRLTDDKLAGLIAVSEVILLPITEGGGSNLKTAEAILSGRKIVGTSYAFRSFESYLKLPNIYIADRPEDFQRAITTALNTPLRPLTKKEAELADKVQWEYSLKGVVRVVSEL